MGRIIADFALAHVFASVAIMAITRALDHYAGYQFGNGASFVAYVAAVYFAGARYGLRRGEAPSNSEAWRIAAVLTVVTFAVSLVIMALLYGVSDAATRAQLAAILTNQPFLVLSSVVGIIIACMLVLARFFFPHSARMILARRKS